MVFRRSKGSLLCVQAPTGMAGHDGHQSGHMLNLGSRMVRLAFQVIPMGFNSAVSVFQDLHWRLGFRPRPFGAGHDPN
eukprot:1122076-Amphidinium_carterae.1